MDIQLTDFENAAFTIVLGLIVNVINNFDVNFIMPISKVDENMERAEQPAAYLKQKFYFRTKIVRDKGGAAASYQ